MKYFSKKDSKEKPQNLLVFHTLLEPVGGSKKWTD